MSRPFKLSSRLTALVLAPAAIAGLALAMLAVLAFDTGRPGLGSAAGIAAVAVLAGLSFGLTATLGDLERAMATTTAWANHAAGSPGTDPEQIPQTPIREFTPIDTALDRLGSEYRLATAQAQALGAGTVGTAIFDRSVSGPLGKGLSEAAAHLRDSRTALNDARSVTSSVLDSAHESIVLADGSGNVLAANHAATIDLELFGDLDTAIPGWQRLPAGDHTITDEGAARLVRASVSRVLTAAGAITVLGWRDISEERAWEDEATRTARTDMVTGLPNRQGLIVAHDRLVELDRSASVIHVDLNDFNAINQHYGYESGDVILTELARRLTEITSDGDTVARVDGDGFVLLVSSAADNAEPLTRRVLSHIGGPIRLPSGAQVVVSGRAGWSTGRADSSRELLRRAQYALAEAASQPGGICGYTTELAQSDEHRRRTGSELRQALAGDEFELYAQPIVDVLEKRVLGVEAFLRWQHPTGRLITPAEFIPVAEETATIADIDRWVITRCIAEASKADPSLVFSMNVSSRFMATPELADHVLESLATTGLAAARVQIDVTETNVATDAQGVIESIKRLNQVGVQVALDDFGSGYSSLAHLLKLDVSTIKIDRRMVSLVTEPEGRGVIGAILAFAKRRDLTVVAEGVETPDEAATLADLGCRFQQGYLHGYPAPLGDVLAAIAGGSSAALEPAGCPTPARAGSSA